MTNSPLAGASARPLVAACPQQTATAIVAAADDLLGHLAALRGAGIKITAGTRHIFDDPVFSHERMPRQP